MSHHTVDRQAVRSATQWIGLDFSENELRETVDLFETLLAEKFPPLDDGITSPTETDKEFEIAPYRPHDAANPYNMWITRFELAKKGRDGLLSGYDLAVKDNICVGGVELTCGSHEFEGFVPESHAPVVRRLLNAGARVVGKTNMDEFAFGPTGESSAFGPTKNPRDTGCVTGGSSSGSAAAVASGAADLALGTDTGGSVRMPASYCGVVGIKPTFGLVPMKGIVPLAPSLDHVGPIAADIETAAICLGVLTGQGEKYSDGLGMDPSSTSIGVADNLFPPFVQESVEGKVREAVERIEDVGATVHKVDLPTVETFHATWWGLCPLEFALAFATSNVGVGYRTPVNELLATELNQIKYSSKSEMGLFARQMLVFGAYLFKGRGLEDYARAQNYRVELTHRLATTLKNVDVIIAPTTPTTAMTLGEYQGEAPVSWLTQPANITGHPSVSLPCGTVDGLPVGLQLIGRQYGERALLDIAYELEHRIEV